MEASIHDDKVKELVRLCNVERKDLKGLAVVEFGSKHNPEASQTVISTDTEKDFIQSLMDLYNVSKGNFIMVKSRFEGESGEKIEPVIERNEIVSGFSYTHQADTYKTTYCYSSLVKAVLMDVAKGESIMKSVLKGFIEREEEIANNRSQLTQSLDSLASVARENSTAAHPIGGGYKPIISNQGIVTINPRAEEQTKYAIGLQ